MLDFDLALLYEVETKRINEQVKRNLDKFPLDFMFRLTLKEWEFMRSQNATASQKKRNANITPYVFTEHGVTMLASVLKSKKAIDMNIAIVRAFTAMRCGYKVVEAKNGQHALKKYLEHKDGIHMLISDLVMPDISGVVLAEHIRGLQSDIRILFISGYIRDQETRDRLLDDNRNFLQKPFSPKVFASRVRAALDLNESGIEP